MPEGEWPEVNRILGDLLELPAAERQSRLDSLALAAPVRRRVEDLLLACNNSEGFLESPLLSLAELPPDRMIGQRFGVWRLLSVIGSGGMGTVYLAERDDRQFVQRAAVKLIAAGGMNRVAEQRFREERQILARLEHPNVARLIDGGLAADGSPFLAMEFIEGTAIGEWCVQNNLDISGRLQLFLQLCAAVQFAHQNLIVHCDLKPANILVTRDGVTKLLDFGIARIVGQQHEATATVARRMTLDYASPEQVRGVALTTASDIYSLGVLLHELVTARRPYRLEGKPLEEVLAIVCEQEVARPGTRSPDLDAIILKALRKDPAGRYASAAEMAADVTRYLAGRPVEARSATAFYVLRRFASRHRLAAAIAAVLALFVLSGAAIVTRESRIALRRFNSVRRLAHFVIFDMHDAVAPLPGSTPVRKLLVAQGLQYLDELARDAPGDPQLQLELAASYLRLGDASGLMTEANLGDTKGAIDAYRKALDLLEPLRRSDPVNPAMVRTLAAAYQHLADVEQHRDPAAAMAAAEKLIEFRRQQPVEAAGDESRAGLATAYDTRAGAADVLGQHDQALRDGLSAVSIWEDLLARSPANAIWQRNAALAHKYTAGRLLASGQDLTQTQLHLRRAEELDEGLVQSKPSDREARMDLSFDLSQDGFFQWHRLHNPAGARELYSKALSIREELLQADPSDARLKERVGYLQFNLALLAMELGNPGEAATHADASERIEREVYLRESSPANRRRLADAAQFSGRANLAAGHRRAACEAWERCRQLVNENIRLGQAGSEERQWLADVTSRLPACASSPSPAK
jgi:tetratricopeptide (TPR) repeat protein